MKKSPISCLWLSITFAPTRRSRWIRLLQGEATFKVARDPSRPFRVHTPDTTVEAVGTQFNIYARADGTTTVSVLEGKVKVTGGNSLFSKLTAASLPMAAGEQAQVRASGAIERQTKADVADSIAWQRRRLVFKHTSLADMAMEFNRYNKSMRIRLDGIDANTFRFTGAFEADDPESLAVVLMREPDLSIERNGQEIVIRRAGAAANGVR
jgi:transmembrane sensor